MVLPGKESLIEVITKRTNTRIPSTNFICTRNDNVEKVVPKPCPISIVLVLHKIGQQSIG
jgi:hypothetical protein